MILLRIITISRQEGSLGEEIAGLLAEKLGVKLIARDETVMEWMREVAGAYQLRMLKESPKFYLNATGQGGTFKDYLENRLKSAAAETPSVILGLGAQIIFSGHPETVNIRTIASNETRRRRIALKYGLPEKDADNMLTMSDSKHKRYISTLYGKDWSDPLLYQITMNTDGLDAEECADAIFRMLTSEGGQFGTRKEHLPGIMEHAAAKEQTSQSIFKHPAEMEFARILDMYSIEWQYEPRTFPVEWDAEGNVTMAFSPDFYLIKFDTYIEITTMEQKYVTTKNKKVRLLKELYPDINIKIVYKKDFYTLLKRFSTNKGDDT